MENLLLILQRAISEEKKKIIFLPAEFTLYQSSQWDQCGDPLPWSCDRHLQFKWGGGHTWFILPVVGQPLYLSSFPLSPPFMGHMVSHGTNTNWKLTRKCHLCLPSCSAGKKKKSGMHLTGAFEHAQKICAILCFCYLGFSKIRDVTRCRC